MEREATKELIRNAIRELGTQQEFAEKIGVDRQTVKMWLLRGEVSKNFLFKFCDLTGVKPSEVNQFAKDLEEYKTERQES